MKFCFAIVLALFCSCLLPAQQPPSLLDDLTPEAAQWLRENLDDSVLQALEQVDQDRVREFFDELQKRFQNDYVYDLGSLQQTAATLLPLLQRYGAVSS